MHPRFRRLFRIDRGAVDVPAAISDELEFHFAATIDELTAQGWTSDVVFAFALGFQQMGIGREIVVTAFALILGALCLALALAFGLGSRGLAERTIEEWARKLRSDK